MRAVAKRAYRYRFQPNEEQRELLARTFGCVRVVYNHVLRWRTDAYHDDGESIGYAGANARLTELKKDPDFEWLREVSSVPLQQCLRNQQRAFTNFFEGRAGYPNFKSKHHRQSAEFTRSAFRYRGGQLTLAKCSTPLDVRWSRALPSEPLTVTVSMDAAGRYFVSCLCEFEPVPLAPVAKQIGVDMGLTHLAITSDGVKFDNPKHTARHAAKLAKAQRKLAKKRKGSANRAKAKRVVGQRYAKIADARRDTIHKMTRRLIDENQVVAVEHLNVAGMVKNRSLSKAIHDAAWHEAVRQLKYKGEWAGRTVVVIDRFYPSSKRCNGCGHVVAKLPLDVRRWSCPECGAEHDRDVNAAKNIRAAGLAVLACGGDVRPAA